MQRTTQTLTIAQTLIDAFLNAMTTVPGAALLTTPHLGLCVSPTVISNTSTYASITEPTFHGYAKASVTLVGPVNISNPTQGVLFTANFVATAGGTVADTVTGYWLSDGAAAFYAGEIFQTPVAFGSVGDFLTVNFVLPLTCLQANQ